MKIVIPNDSWIHFLSSPKRPFRRKGISFSQTVGPLILLVFIVAGCTNQTENVQPGSPIAVEIQTVGSRTAETSLKFLVSLPSNYESNVPWPLVVTLHGGGSNAMAFHDLWAPVTDSLGYILCTPQGDVEYALEGGWTWGENAELLIMQSVEWIQRKVFVHPQKIYLAGFSSGGSTAYRIGLKHPELFRGIAPLCATFESEWMVTPKSVLSSFLVYIGHGEEDGHISHAREAYRLLSLAGPTVHMSVYKQTRHALPDPIEEELQRILLWFDSPNHE